MAGSLSLRLLLSILVVSTGVLGKEVEDTNNSIDFKAVLPGEAGSGGDTLELQCDFDITKTDFASVLRMDIRRCPEGDDEDPATLAFTMHGKVFNLAGESVVSATGSLDNHGVSTLKLTFVAADGGYGRSYKCIAIGRYASKMQELYYTTIQVEPLVKPEPIGEQLNELSGRVDQCCEASETANNNTILLESLAEKVESLSALPGESQKQGEQLETLAERVSALSSNEDNYESNVEDMAAMEEKISSVSEKLASFVESNAESRKVIEALAASMQTVARALRMYLSISTVKYDVSALHNGHIYIASKDEPKFDLAEMNELCAESNGYLAELDDDEEEEFVEVFVASIGEYTFAIGANDVANEGEFVYYNSKKPVPDSLWMKGQPSNSWGIEDCVQIRNYGLNDIKCNQSMRYVCEIPLK